jgi:PadR family transcriptional regulator PadR
MRSGVIKICLEHHQHSWPGLKVRFMPVAPCRALWMRPAEKGRVVSGLAPARRAGITDARKSRGRGTASSISRPGRLRRAHFFYKQEVISPEGLGRDRMTNELNSLEQQMMLAITKLMPNAYGVAIGDHIERVTGRSYSIGAIYNALDRLEGRGFLEARQGEATATRGGRRKLYFDLTATGQLALKQSLAMIDKLRKTPARAREAFA